MIFWLALGFVALERVGEMAWARRNAKRLLAQGARFVREDGMGLIVATHVLFFVLAGVVCHFLVVALYALPEI